MNGYGSQRSATTAALRAIHAATMAVWPIRNFGVPKKRANASAFWPNLSVPKAAACWESAIVRKEFDADLPVSASIVVASTYERPRSVNQALSTLLLVPMEDVV